MSKDTSDKNYFGYSVVDVENRWTMNDQSQEDDDVESPIFCSSCGYEIEEDEFSSHESIASQIVEQVMSREQVLNVTRQDDGNLLAALKDPLSPEAADLEMELHNEELISTVGSVDSGLLIYLRHVSTECQRCGVLNVIDADEEMSGLNPDKERLQNKVDMFRQSADEDVVEQVKIAFGEKDLSKKFHQSVDFEDDLLSLYPNMESEDDGSLTCKPPTWSEVYGGEDEDLDVDELAKELEEEMEDDDDWDDPRPSGEDSDISSIHDPRKMLITHEEQEALQNEMANEITERGTEFIDRSAEVFEVEVDDDGSVTVERTDE